MDLVAIQRLGIRYDEVDRVPWRWRQRAWAAHAEEHRAGLQQAGGAVGALVKAFGVRQ